MRRLRKQNGLTPRRRRRFVLIRDSDHDSLINPFIAKDFDVHGPDQLWVADLTYTAIAGGFDYAAWILHAWSQRVAGCATRRRIDARLAVHALR